MATAQYAQQQRGGREVGRAATITHSNSFVIISLWSYLINVDSPLGYQGRDHISFAYFHLEHHPLPHHINGQT